MGDWLAVFIIPAVVFLPPTIIGLAAARRESKGDQ